MKQLIAAIFGSSKNTETIVDGAVSGLDKMFFTKEEKAEANQRLSEWYLKYRGIELWVLGVVESEALYSEFVFRVLTEIVMTPFSIVVGFYFLTHVVRTYQSEKK